MQLKLFTDTPFSESAAEFASDFKAQLKWCALNKVS